MKNIFKLLITALVLSFGGFTVYAGEVQIKIEAENLTEVPNAVVLNEKLVAGGAPTARGLGQAAEQGIRTVIDLREPKEGTAQEKDHADAVGLKYVNIPVSLDNFSSEQADQLSKVLNDPATGPALLHCASGQRAVALWALERNKNQNIPGEQVLEEAKAKGLKKPELVLKLQSLVQNK